MSGIFGRLELDGRPLDIHRFQAQFALLRHFGPDRSEHRVEGNMGVGQHQLFVSRYASLEKLSSLSDAFVLAADAILDNRSDLVSRLALASRASQGLSDNELIRLSYRKWGIGCFEYLVGSYAVAIVRRNAPEVILVRDPVGTRPLFWAQRGNTVTFGSSIEAIVADPQFDWPISEASIAEYMAWPATPRSEAMFVHVRRVPPGSWVKVARGEVLETRWWQPEKYAGRPPRRDEEVAEEASHLLREIIADQVDTPYKAASHFSGGIDSTIVTLLAARQLKNSGRRLAMAYSWSPEVRPAYPLEHPQDERRRLLRIAELEGFPLRLGTSDEHDFLEFLDRPFELEGRADLVDELPIMRQAGKDGIRVLLSGWGGDEAFSTFGLGHIAELVASGRFRKGLEFAKKTGLSFKSGRRSIRSVWEGALVPMLPASVQRRLSSAPDFFVHDSFVSQQLARQQADQIRSSKVSLLLKANLKANLLKSLAADPVPMRMETWAAMSAEHSFQYRYPLADRRLHEFLLGLTSEQLVLGNTPRGLSLAVYSGLTSEATTKYDYANELRRRTVRERTWEALAAKVRYGAIEGDCPWVDIETFSQIAGNPQPQDKIANTSLFLEVVTGARILSLHRRMYASGSV